jgi:hypothetical protein
MSTASAAASVALFGIVIMQGACATIVHGTTQVVPITSSPPGATVTIDSVRVGRTPHNATLSRGRPHHLVIAPDSGTAFEISVEQSMSPLVWGNFFLYILPIFLDFSNGAAYDLSPKAVQIDFPGSGPGTLGEATGRSIANGDRIRVLTTSSPDSFVYATVDSTALGRLFVRRATSAAFLSWETAESLSMDDVRRLDVSHAPRRGETSQLTIRVASQIALGVGAVYSGLDPVGTLFIGGLANIVATPVGALLGYAGAPPRWSPFEAHRTGSPLLVGDRLRVHLTDSTSRSTKGRLLDIDGPHLLITDARDTVRILRTNIVSVERKGGVHFGKAALLAIGVGAAIGVVEVGSRNFPTAQSEWVIVPLASALLTLYSTPAFGVRRWVKVPKW